MQLPVTDPCEHDNEFLGSLHGENICFMESLRNHRGWQAMILLYGDNVL